VHPAQGEGTVSQRITHTQHLQTYTHIQTHITNEESKGRRVDDEKERGKPNLGRFVEKLTRVFSHWREACALYCDHQPRINRQKRSLPAFEKSHGVVSLRDREATAHASHTSQARALASITQNTGLSLVRRTHASSALTHDSSAFMQLHLARKTHASSTFTSYVLK